MKETPHSARMYLLLAAFFALLPSLVGMYTGETQRFIVASRTINDPNFSETVVFMFFHGLGGAHGVVVNRPLPLEDKDNVPDYIRNSSLPLFVGGPVDYPDRITILERRLLESGKSELVSVGFDEAVKENPAYLSQLRGKVKAGQVEARVYLGYAGWGALQLENEFRHGNWASTRFEIDWAFYQGSAKEVWLKAVEAATKKRKPRDPRTI